MATNEKGALLTAVCHSCQGQRVFSDFEIFDLPVRTEYVVPRRKVLLAENLFTTAEALWKSDCRNFAVQSSLRVNLQMRMRGGLSDAVLIAVKTSFYFRIFTYLLSSYGSYIHTPCQERPLPWRGLACSGYLLPGT